MQISIKYTSIGRILKINIIKIALKVFRLVFKTQAKYGVRWFSREP